MERMLKLLAQDIPGGQGGPELTEDQIKEAAKLRIARENVRGYFRKLEPIFRQHRDFMRMTSGEYRRLVECVADYLCPIGERITDEQMILRGFDPKVIKQKAAGVRGVQSYIRTEMRDTGATEVRTNRGTNPRTFAGE